MRVKVKIMNICEIMKADCANGPGVRVSLFVSGCTNHCKGCFNPETWDFNYGVPWTPALEQYLLDELKKSFYDGLTILGGEPFEFVNQAALFPLIERVRQTMPEKTIWIYTGFTYETDLSPGGVRYGPYTDRILDAADILVDGRFDLRLKNILLRFRGSENQRIIDLPNTRKNETVTLLQ